MEFRARPVTFSTRPCRSWCQTIVVKKSSGCLLILQWFRPACWWNITFLCAGRPTGCLELRICKVLLCRTIQEPGQFIVVFPKVFTSSISTGYVVSESVYFAPLHWLKTARNLFNDLKTSCEPSMFSLNKLIVQIANDSRSSVEVLRLDDYLASFEHTWTVVDCRVIVPFIEELVANENENRRKIRSLAQITQERITATESVAKKKRIQNLDGDLECEVCRTNLFVSMVGALKLKPFDSLQCRGCFRLLIPKKT